MPGEIGGGFTASFNMVIVFLLDSCQMRLFVVQHFYRAFITCFFKRLLKAIIIMEVLVVKVRINMESCIFSLMCHKTRWEKITCF